ncbi:hypothetical protein FQN49_007257 [Arthroderma sp. PD_2]|nr:hypothetical protein FQN49_007257 [Arthroderma sp. PD_2]
MSGPDAELRDVRRQELIEGLLSRLKVQGTGYKILPPLFWAALWYSDLTCLENIITELIEDKERAFYYTGRLTNPVFTSLWATVHSGASTPKSQPATPRHDRTLSEGEAPEMASGSPARKRKRAGDDEVPASNVQLQTLAGRKLSRSKEAAENCHKRDTMCVITKATEPCEAAHIVPFSLGSQPEYAQSLFWDTLRCFWPKDKVDRWQQYLEQNSTEVVRNLVLLAPSVHRYWDRQLFALEPVDISDDKKTLRLRFYWLRSNTSVTPLALDNPAEFAPPEMPSDLKFGGRRAKYAATPNVRLYNCETDTRITSGDIITLRTDDPEHLPLPDIELFRLQWLLHRVTSLSAAAEYDSDEEDYDDFAPELVTTDDGVDMFFTERSARRHPFFAC